MRFPQPPLIVLVAGLLFPGLAAAQGFDSPGEQQMLARINAMRAAQNLTPLSRNPALDAAARAHSSDMATQEQLTHVSDTSGTPADRVRAAGLSASSVAENVALHRTAAEAHDALIASEAHRANMLSESSTHIGLAALPTERGVYVTQVFAAIEPQAEAPVAPDLVPPSVPVNPPSPAEAPPPADAPPAGPQAPPPGAGLQAPPPAVGPPPAPPTPPAPPSPPTASASPVQGTLRAQPGSFGTVVVHRSDRGAVLAYWVYGSGRWWYYPFPPGALPGQRLQVDPSVQGPPAGFPAHPARGAAQPAPPRPAPQVRPLAPAPGGRSITIAPFQGRVMVSPGARFFAVPPPPMVGHPTRAWRRQHRAWRRAYRRWQRQQERLRRRAL